MSARTLVAALALTGVIACAPPRGAAATTHTAAPSALVVYHLADDIMTDVAVGPGRLPTFTGVRTFRAGDAVAARVRAAVLHARTRSASREQRGIDARWLLVFASGTPRRVACDRSCDVGAVDGRLVRFSGTSLAPFLRRTFH